MKKFSPLLAAGLLLLAGCSPKPDASLVLYEQPSPQLAAQAHVKERPGLIWYSILPSGSMEPLMTGGDTIVVDTTVPFDRASLPVGSVCNYAPATDQRPYYPGLQVATLTHMLAAWSGEEAIMDGIANKHYERGALRMRKDTYVGKVIKIYTKRKAP